MVLFEHTDSIEERRIHDIISNWLQFIFYTTSKRGILIANIDDFSKPPEKISYPWYVYIYFSQVKPGYFLFAPNHKLYHVLKLTQTSSCDRTKTKIKSSKIYLISCPLHFFYLLKWYSTHLHVYMNLLAICGSTFCLVLSGTNF